MGRLTPRTAKEEGCGDVQRVRAPVDSSPHTCGPQLPGAHDQATGQGRRPGWRPVQSERRAPRRGLLLRGAQSVLSEMRTFNAGKWR